MRRNVLQCATLSQVWQTFLSRSWKSLYTYTSTFQWGFSTNGASKLFSPGHMFGSALCWYSRDASLCLVRHSSCPKHNLSHIIYRNLNKERKSYLQLSLYVFINLRTLRSLPYLFQNISSLCHYFGIGYTPPAVSKKTRLSAFLAFILILLPSVLQ